MKKEKIVIIFTDIDYTFTPIGIKGMNEFVNLVKEIEKKEKVKVKVCPISGRPPAYVMAIMNMVNWSFKESQIEGAVDYGGGEQGAVIVMMEKENAPEFIGDSEDDKLKLLIRKLVKNSKMSKYLQENPYNVHMISYLIKEELKSSLDENMQEEILKKVKYSLEKKIKDKVNISFAKDCIEIVPNSIGKNNAIDWILCEYNKEYDIVGTLFSGDSENDYKAIKRILKLGKTKGINASVILPSNACDLLKEEVINSNQVNSNKNSKGIISKEPLFQGVMNSIMYKMNNVGLTGDVFKLDLINECKFDCLNKKHS